MKKIMLLMALVALLAMPNVAQSQQFEGKWVVSDYREGGNRTATYDGDTVTIVERDGVYFLDGPDWFFAETRFKLHINTLVGKNMPDIERLRTNWPTIPVSVLGNAYGKIVFNGTLTMLQNGRIVGEHDNWEISWYTRSGRFGSVQRYPGYIQFILTRKR